MKSRKEFEDLFGRSGDRSRQIRDFVTLLSEETGLGLEGLMVVGGSAIEIYTRGGYVSEDIDLVVSDRKAVERVLRLWGFRDEGKLWTRADLRLYVDVMEKENSGSRRLARTVQSELGSIRITAIEDLVVKRLLEARYWSQPAALAHAVLLIRQFDEELDWPYITFYVQRDDLSDLLREARKRAGRPR